MLYIFDSKIYITTRGAQHTQIVVCVELLIETITKFLITLQHTI